MIRTGLLWHGIHAAVTIALAAAVLWHVTQRQEERPIRDSDGAVASLVGQKVVTMPTELVAEIVVDHPDRWEPFREASSGLSGTRLRPSSTTAEWLRVVFVGGGKAPDGEQQILVLPGGYYVSDQAVLRIVRASVDESASGSR